MVGAGAAYGAAATVVAGAPAPAPCAAGPLGLPSAMDSEASPVRGLRPACGRARAASAAD
jgi:hypothetical protein